MAIESVSEGMPDVVKSKGPKGEVAMLLFEQISFIAMNVRGLNRIPEDDDIHISAALMASIAGMVAQIGWLADMGAESLGGMASLSADPKDWMLSPAYHQAVESIGNRTAAEVSHD